jgi:hypothetical protein
MSEIDLFGEEPCTQLTIYTGDPSLSPAFLEWHRKRVEHASDVLEAAVTADDLYDEGAD